MDLVVYITAKVWIDGKEVDLKAVMKDGVIIALIVILPPVLY